MTAARLATGALPLAMLLARPAAADDAACAGAPVAAQLVAARGQVRAGATCGAFLVETDAADTSFSFGQVRWGQVSAPFELDVRVRRLTADSVKSIELQVPGGTVLLRDGAIGLYASEAQFEASGWQPLPGFRQRDEHEVVVRQVGDRVDVRVDGADVAAWRLPGAPVAGDVTIGLKGARAYRGRLLVRALRLRELPRSTPGSRR